MKLPDGVFKFDPSDPEHAAWRARARKAASKHLHGPKRTPYRLKIAGKPGGPTYDVNHREEVDPFNGERVDGKWAGPLAKYPTLDDLADDSEPIDHTNEED